MRIGLKKELLEVEKLEKDLSDRRFDRRLRVSTLIAQLVGTLSVSSVAAYGIYSFQEPQVALTKKKAVRDNDAKIIELYLGRPVNERDRPETLQMLIAMFDEESSVYPIFLSKLSAAVSGPRVDCLRLSIQLAEARLVYEQLERTLQQELTVGGLVKADGTLTKPGLGPISAAIRQQLVKQRGVVNALEYRFALECPSSAGSGSD